MSVGILISTVGTDPIYGAYRFTFGSPILADGIEYLGVMVGAYGLGEVLSRLERGFTSPTRWKRLRSLARVADHGRTQ